MLGLPVAAMLPLLQRWLSRWSVLFITSWIRSMCSFLWNRIRQRKYKSARSRLLGKLSFAQLTFGPERPRLISYCSHGSEMRSSIPNVTDLTEANLTRERSSASNKLAKRPVHRGWASLRHIASRLRTKWNCRSGNTELFLKAMSQDAISLSKSVSSAAFCSRRSSTTYFADLYRPPPLYSHLYVLGGLWRTVDLNNVIRLTRARIARASRNEKSWSNFLPSNFFPPLLFTSGMKLVKWKLVKWNNLVCLKKLFTGTDISYLISALSCDILNHRGFPVPVFQFFA